MKVSDLYGFDGPCYGRDVYIVGTGPSLRVFPVDFLKDRCCILLNTAHRILPDVGPIAFSNRLDFLQAKPGLHDECRCDIQIVKGRLKWQDSPGPERTDNHVRWSDERYHVFSYREPPWDSFSHFDEVALWKEPDFYWNVNKGTVAIFAAQFAALAGAKSVSLIGCDCVELGGRDGGGKEIESLACAARANRGPKGMVHHYEQYAAGLNRLAKELRKRFNIPLLHLSPFPGFSREQQQFREFQEWGDNGWR